MAFKKSNLSFNWWIYSFTSVIVDTSGLDSIITFKFLFSPIFSISFAIFPSFLLTVFLGEGLLRAPFYETSNTSKCDLEFSITHSNEDVKANIYTYLKTAQISQHQSYMIPTPFTAHFARYNLVVKEEVSLRLRWQLHIK